MISRRRRLCRLPLLQAPPLRTAIRSPGNCGEIHLITNNHPLKGTLPTGAHPRGNMKLRRISPITPNIAMRKG